jgi:hypothetical protein
MSESSTVACHSGCNIQQHMTSLSICTCACPPAGWAAAVAAAAAAVHDCSPAASSTGKGEERRQLIDRQVRQTAMAYTRTMRNSERPTEKIASVTFHDDKSATYSTVRPGSCNIFYLTFRRQSVAAAGDIDVQ